MKRFNLFYFIGQAFRSIFRNAVASLSAIAVLLSCLVVMGGFTLLVENLNMNLDQLGLMNDIVVFLQYDATEEDAARIGDEIRSLGYLGVDEVTYVSKAQGLAEMKEQYAEYGDIYSEITEADNPLSDSYRITFTDNSKVATLEHVLRNDIEGVRKVNSSSDVSVKIEKIKSGVSMTFVWFLILLFVICVFIIINTIKLGIYARRDEIAVMRYVGATRGFIIAPFLIQGMIIGAVSSVAAYFIEKYIYNYIERTMMAEVQVIKLIPFAQLSSTLILGFLAIGITTGVFGSFISLQKHVEV